MNTSDERTETGITILPKKTDPVHPVHSLHGVRNGQRPQFMALGLG
jgi:hypothetical protein